MQRIIEVLAEMQKKIRKRLKGNAGRNERQHEIQSREVGSLGRHK
jgi:hypothetical protein